MYLQAGTLLQGGKYRIERYIASGGFGCTYVARHQLFNKDLAIKEFFVKDFCNRDADTGKVCVGIDSKRALVDKMQTKFISEAQALFDIRHSNIVRVTDVFLENGTAYYVMDYIDGAPLSRIVEERGALSEKAAVGYIRQVAEALRYIHGINRLHLDVKPQNIMVDSSGKAILIDFGVSKQYDEVSGENTSTLVGYTPGYAPAEQMGNNIANFSPATDIYALGATLYKILSGDTPPSATDRAGGDEPKPLPAGISTSLRNAVCQAMQLNRRMRPQSIAEFLALIDDVGAVGTAGSDETVITSDVTADTVVADNDSMVHVAAEEYDEVPGKRTFNVKGVKFSMVAVEGGTFRMGEKGGFLGFLKDNRQHSVSLDGFHIGETVVTQELWLAVMGNNPSRFKGDMQCPVENVSWNDCQEFIKKLNGITGKNFRLPTEAEWEYAARGGNKSRGYKYSGSDNIGDVAWCDSNSNDKTHPVKTKKANELGIYDMSGNVWECCHDWYDGAYYSSSPQNNPKGPRFGSSRVLRGGCWGSDGQSCRVVDRNYDYPYARKNFYSGLRLAL